MNKPPISRTCEWCGRGFTPPPGSRKRTCSRQCHYQLITNNRHDRETFGHAWTPTEIEQVRLMVGNHQPRGLVAAYNVWAGMKGFPIRSRSALLHKARLLEGSVKSSFDGWTVGQICELLGVTPARIDVWIRKGYLKVSQARARTRRAVYRRDLIQLARERPHLFAAATDSDLLFLLEDPDLIQGIRKKHPRRLNGPKEIVRLIDGKVWSSGRALARDNDVSHSHISRYINKCLPIRGHYYVFAEDVRLRPDHCRELLALERRTNRARPA